MITEVILLAVLCFVLRNLFKSSNDSNLPPGPFQWPVLGNAIEILRANPAFPYLAHDKLSKIYGNLMSLKLGIHNMVVVSSYETIRDIFSHDNFAARYKFSFVHARSFNKELGIIWSNGEIHQEVRKFTVKNLRDFGFGKTQSMDALLTEELEEFTSRLEVTVRETGGLIEIHNRYFVLSVVNVLWSLLTGDRFSHDDKELEEVLGTCEKFNDTVKLNNPTVPYPILGTLFPKWTGWADHLKTYKELYAFTEGQIDRREANTKDPQNFLDVFHREIERNKGNPNSPFTKEMFVLTILDLFLAGSETTGNSISYFFLFVSLHPEIQRKIQRDIDSVVPKGSLPAAEDITKMPYMQAAIAETLRMANTVPQVPIRLAIDDYSYKGYKIAKGTAMINNSHSFLRDREYWGDPDVFRPERFITEHGQFVNDERVNATFGFGKRRICPGEALARSSFFMYYATILQKFNFELPSDIPFPTVEPRPFFTLGPYPFKVKVTIRE